MKYAYYPGCSLNSTAKEYNFSLKMVCENLGIELIEPKNWICCGSSPVHIASHLLSISLSWQNLTDIKNHGFNEVLVPCSACFSRFKIAKNETEKKLLLKENIEKIIESKLPHDIEILHPLQVFIKEKEFNKLSKIKSIDLSHLKIACYYGCLLTRPPKIAQFDECEYPMSMDNVLRECGFDTIDWGYKTDCCGASFALSKTDIVLELCDKILTDAKAREADIISVACPLCHANLDLRQNEIEKKFNKKFNIPIFYFTQLMGLSFGISKKNLYIDKHFVSSEEILINVR